MYYASRKVVKKQSDWYTERCRSQDPHLNQTFHVNVKLIVKRR